MQTVTGVIIRDVQVGDNDKIVSVLTREIGLIDVTCKGAMKITSKSSSSTDLFMFSKLCINQNKNRYYLNSAEPINPFYNIRLDLEKFSLASYFSELIRYSVLPEQPCDIVTRLMLNCLYFLDNGKVEHRMIKPIFEMRFMCELGHLPALLGCHICNTYEADTMYFNLHDGKLTCDECSKVGEITNIVALSPRILDAIRYISLIDYKDLFKIKLSIPDRQKLSEITEKYTRLQLSKSFKTLDFYKSILLQ